MDKQFRSLASLILASIALLAAIAATVIGVAWYSDPEFRQDILRVASGRQRSSPAATEVQDWELYLREHEASLGREDAEIVLVEFADFQCPYCKRFAEGVRRELLADYGNRLRVVFKHFPLDQIHPQAKMMAVAAQCAAREGRFWDIHRVFFSQAGTLDLDGILNVGRSLGLSARYAACVVNEETLSEVHQDIADARALGVQGTPTFMINGKIIAGNQQSAVFRSLIEEGSIGAN